ncbi:tetratricopeptide repeat-containing sensor histidine kinase [Psychroserpens mesophilus]|uniref:tetratricopeptide repeat-containing sensor histidine kinase n=1 Tax=Psychroserpens mesophilus TaxID=325473 RepID=UPI003F4997CF
MKTTNTSFLFFYCICSLFIIIANTEVLVQELQDDLDYYSKLALKPQNAEDFLNAYNYFETNYSKALDNNDTFSAVNSLYYLASLQYKSGSFNESETTIVTALKLLKTTGNTKYIKDYKKSFNNLLGMIYVEQNNKEKSLELYDLVLSSSESPSDSAVVYNNIAVVFKDHNEFKKAKEALLRAKAIIPRIKDSLQQALILDNLGVVKSNINISDGLPLMLKALDIRESLKDTSTIYTSYSHLSEYYSRIGNKMKSKEFALKAYELSEKINSATYKRNALSLLTELSDDNYALAYKKLNDSLYKTEKASTNKFALLKYDLSESKRKAIQSKLKEEEQRYLKIIYLTVGIIIILISIFLYFIITSRHKKEKLQEVYNTESRISKKLHDEVANDVFQLMTKLEHEEQIETKVINELQSLYYRTRDISKEHVALNDAYPFGDHLVELIESFQDSQTNIVVKGLSDLDWDAYSEIQKTTIFKVLQEILINMKKHSQASMVALVFQKESKKLVIHYTDNGVGTNLKKGNGLHNTENRIQAIGGTITFDTELNKGFKVKISI